jgi:hypothetical protein
VSGLVSETVKRYQRPSEWLTNVISCHSSQDVKNVPVIVDGAPFAHKDGWELTQCLAFSQQLDLDFVVAGIPQIEPASRYICPGSLWRLRMSLLPPVLTEPRIGILMAVSSGQVPNPNLQVNTRVCNE